MAKTEKATKVAKTEKATEGGDSAETQGPTTAPVQPQDEKHPITGAKSDIQEYVAPEGGFPKSQTVYQADEAVKGDYIVEWVEPAEHVTFHPESNGQFHPLNVQRTIPCVHTRVFHDEHIEDAKAAAEAFAETRKGAKVFKK